MTLGDQLDELRNNILKDRSNRVSGDDDRLWDDDSLLRYIQDGERRFARRTFCLRDSTTPECTRVTLRAGVSTYPLHASVVAVLSARYNTSSVDLARSGHGIVIAAPAPATYDVTTGWTTQPGEPVAFLTDETLVYARGSRTTLTVFPTPSTAEAGKKLALRVCRVPMTEYSQDGLEEESEIQQDYQFDCLEWAAYRALRHFDADAGASSPSEHHKAAFDEAVGNAITELKRTLFANTGFRYGGGGFSYTR